MNYVTQLNAFFRIAGSLGLSSSARMLYLALLNENNSLAWIKTFTCPAYTIKASSGLSTSGLQRARESLVTCKLINYYKHGSNKAPSYSIPELTDSFVLFILNNKANGTPNNTTVNSPNNTPVSKPDNSPNTLTKPNQNKSKQTNNDHQDEDAYKDLITTFQQNFGINSTKPLMLDDLKYTIADFVEQGNSYIEAIEIVKYALKIAVAHQASSWSYVKGIVKTWLAKSLFDMKSIKEYQDKPSGRGKGKQQSKPDPQYGKLF